MKYMVNFSSEKQCLGDKEKRDGAPPSEDARKSVLPHTQEKALDRPVPHSLGGRGMSIFIIFPSIIKSPRAGCFPSE